MEKWYESESPRTVKNRSDSGKMCGIDRNLIAHYWPQLDLFKRVMVLVGKYVEIIGGSVVFLQGWNTTITLKYEEDNLNSENDTRYKKGLEDRLVDDQMAPHQVYILLQMNISNGY